MPRPMLTSQTATGSESRPANTATMTVTVGRRRSTIRAAGSRLAMNPRRRERQAGAPLQRQAEGPKSKVKVKSAEQRRVEPQRPQQRPRIVRRGGGLEGRDPSSTLSVSNPAVESLATGVEGDLFEALRQLDAGALDIAFPPHQGLSRRGPKARNATGALAHRLSRQGDKGGATSRARL